jgi:hypothetical protein
LLVPWKRNSPGRDELIFVRVDDGLDAVAEAKFLEDASDVRFRRCLGDDEFDADLGVR